MQLPKPPREKAGAEHGWNGVGVPGLSPSPRGPAFGWQASAPWLPTPRPPPRCRDETPRTLPTLWSPPLGRTGPRAGRKSASA